MIARRLVLSSLVLVAALLMARPAAAEKVNRAFAGKIMLSEKRFPTQAKSLAAFNAKIRSLSKTSFMENKEKKGWLLHFAGFLKQPLNDVEYLVKIYELTGRSQQLLVTFEQFTDQRGQTALISKFLLERKHVGVNKQLMITLENKGKVLAAQRFRILGEAERFTGKVDFSEEEAAGGSEE